LPLDLGKQHSSGLLIHYFSQIQYIHEITAAFSFIHSPALMGDAFYIIYLSYMSDI